MSKVKISKKKKTVIVAVELIIIAITAAIIFTNFTPKKETVENKSEKPNIEYLSGRYYTKDICNDLKNCNVEIGTIRLDNKDYKLKLNIKDDAYILHADDQEIYNLTLTDIDYIEVIDNYYIIVHQVHSNGTYQTDIYNNKLTNFFHIISRKVKSKDTDMWVENQHNLYYYDYSCSNTDKRYAAKFYVDLTQDVNAPILQIETYKDDYMPNCNAN